MGRQWVGAVVNLVSYYCGALPGGIYLAFHGWGLAGLWIGQCVALYLVGALEWVIVGMSSWEAEVKRALLRLEEGESEITVGSTRCDLGTTTGYKHRAVSWRHISLCSPCPPMLTPIEAQKVLRHNSGLRRPTGLTAAS
jgi:hypothetical protein